MAKTIARFVIAAVVYAGVWAGQLPGEWKGSLRSSLFVVDRDPAKGGSAWDGPAVIIAGTREERTARDLKILLTRMFNVADVQSEGESPWIQIEPVAEERGGKKIWPTVSHELALEQALFEVRITPEETKPVALRLEVFKVKPVPDKESGHLRALKVIADHPSPNGKVLSLRFQGHHDWPVFLVIADGRRTYVTTYWWRMMFVGRL